jgi:hypothetical protein
VVNNATAGRVGFTFGKRTQGPRTLPTSIFS